MSLSKKLGCGPNDEISRVVILDGKRFHAVINRGLNYIGISTEEEGPTRFFAQGEDADQHIADYDEHGPRSFVLYLNGYGFW